MEGEKKDVCPTCGAAGDEPCEHREKQETLDREQEVKDREQMEAAKEGKALEYEHEKNQQLHLQLKTATEKVALLQMQNVSIQKIIKEDQDSIEIGEQKTGRIKVYGTAGKKAEFAAKIKEQLELLEATRGKLKEMDGGSDEKKGSS